MSRKKKKKNKQPIAKVDRFSYLPFGDLDISPKTEPEPPESKNQPIPKTPDDIENDLSDNEWGPNTSEQTLRDNTDDAEFEQMMQGISQIEYKKKLANKKTVIRKPKNPMDDADVVMRLLDDMVTGKTYFDIKDTDEYIEAVVHDLDRRIVKKLRKGEYSVQANIDLHGMRRDEARYAVAKFIDRCYRENKRCVLVVHGRGLGSKDHIPVLKEKLTAWLTRGVIGKKVLAYTSARPCDGGTGAVYVLLRN